ncbi:MAG: hypothetical protein Q9168_001663 [Polycauliona sp. 1 TL-2023]
MAPNYNNGTVFDPLQPLAYLAKAPEYTQSSANLDLYPHAPQAGPEKPISAGSPDLAPHQNKVPPKRKPPVRRKIASTTSEGRITRANKKKPLPGPSVLRASLIARAHIIASQGETPAAEERNAFPTYDDIQPYPDSMPILPQAHRGSTPAFPTPCCTFDNVSNTFGLLAEQEHHQQELARADQALGPRSLLNTAPILPLLIQQPLRFSTNPHSPLNRSLYHHLPPPFTSMYPVPRGLEDPATNTSKEPFEIESMGCRNYERSIVTYRRLGFRFDEIATKFHLAGFDPDGVTPMMVEGIWRRNAEDEEYPLWYEDGMPKLRVFEKDDPDYM